MGPPRDLQSVVTPGLLASHIYKQGLSVLDSVPAVPLVKPLDLGHGMEEESWFML